MTQQQAFKEELAADVQVPPGYTHLSSGRCDVKGKEGERAGANFVEAQIQQYKSFILRTTAGAGTFMVRLDYSGGSDKNLQYVSIDDSYSTQETFNIRSVSMNKLRGLFAAGKSSANLSFYVFGKA